MEVRLPSELMVKAETLFEPELVAYKNFSSGVTATPEGYVPAVNDGPGTGKSAPDVGSIEKAETTPLTSLATYKKLPEAVIATETGFGAVENGDPTISVRLAPEPTENTEMSSDPRLATNRK